MEMIEVKNLVREYEIAKRDKNFFKYVFSRQYETVRAVDNISFNVAKGELVGFIGPNGAGKSTTIKMLTGILVPTEGHMSVLGRTPHLQRKENASQIGVVFGQRTQLWWDLPVDDSFDLLRRIYKIPANVFKDNIESMSDMLDLKSFINKPVRQLSLGQRMRADLAAALLHSPEILFLDEPTIGLDVVVKKQIREFIKRLRKEKGITVILTTHDMKDIEEICERIVMIDHGKIVLDMGVREVEGKLGGVNTLVVDFEEEPKQIVLPFVEVVSQEGGRWKFAFHKEKITANELIMKLSAVSTIRDLTLKEPDIEDIIRDIYMGQGRVS